MKISNEESTLRRLQGEGWNGDVQQLRLLAVAGNALRKRYENACNYQWATSDAYERHTTRLEQMLREDAARVGLTIYLQTDPRGATVYVRPAPLPIRDNAYTTDAVCLTPEREDA